MTLPLGGTSPQKFLRLKALEAVQMYSNGKQTGKAESGPQEI
jgi:hypothetical protein